MNRFRVMIVDDDPDIRFVLANLLKPALETVEAENGLDALEKVERYEPDLMLLDVTMPIMNGFQCCQGVRRHPQYHRLPVFFLSGHGDQSTYAEAYGSGATAYLEKPIDPAQLLELIQTHIQEKKRVPSPKAFTIEELRVVDRTPLRPVASALQGADTNWQAEMSGKRTRDPAGPGLETERGERGKKRGRRRVFGRGARETPMPSREGLSSGSPGAPESTGSAAHPEETPPRPGAPTPPAREADRTAFHESPQPQGEQNQPAPIQPHYGRVEHPHPVAGPAGRRTLRTRKPATSAEPPSKSSRSSPPEETTPSKRTYELPGADLGARVLGLPSTPQVPNSTPSTPTSTPPAPAPPAPVPAASVDTKPESAPYPRILVINPDPREIVAFAEGVRSRGEFLPLEDPVEAIELIARFQPEIVFCPVVMKGWDGLQLILMLRGNPRLAHVQVLFFTDSGEDSTRCRFAERECGYPLILRPVKGENVATLIDRVVSSPGFTVRAKRASYGEFVRDVLKKIEQKKESRRKMREREAHERHLAGWAKFLATELKDYRPPSEAVAGSPIRDYYLP